MSFSSVSTKCWIFLLVAVGCYHSINAQVFSLGQCPDVTVVSPFDSDKYLGTWYNNQNYFAIFQAGLDCVTANYAKNSDNITVTNTGYNIITRGKQVALGSARVVEPGKLSVNFPGAPSSQAANYLILDTDYTSYAVVWDCSNLGPIRISFAWLLTRDQVPPAATVTKALSVFQKYSININKLKVNNQNNCPA